MTADLEQYTRTVATQARQASHLLATVSTENKNEWLRASAKSIRERTGEIRAANETDLQRAPDYGLTSAAIDRLRLTEPRLEAIAAALEDVTQLPDPIGEVIEGHVSPNGLEITRVRVPLGVVFFIYESRPNVTVDAAALCVKSGNAVILRGGKEAFHSNRALHAVMSEALAAAALPEHAVQLVETPDREAVGHFLGLREFIDVTIPRGGKSLIERVTRDAAMPVIKHFEGICHVYVDRSADLKTAAEITVNSKCQRPGVCNAAETLLVHGEIAEEFLPHVAGQLTERGVTLKGCVRTRQIIPDAEPAAADDYRTEWLDLILSVKVVSDLEEAISHINENGSHHTDAIITTDVGASRRFTAAVDSAAVMVNASTRFNDGGVFGLGAEIGISTDKFHARGPCGLRELTSYKYVVRGNGQVRN